MTMGALCNRDPISRVVVRRVWKEVTVGYQGNSAAVAVAMVVVVELELSSWHIDIAVPPSRESSQRASELSQGYPCRSRERMYPLATFAYIARHQRISMIERTFRGLSMRQFVSFCLIRPI